MKRFAAVLVASTMIIGALWYKGVIGGDGATGGSSTRTTSPAATIRLLCASEFKSVCSSLADSGNIDLVGIEDPGVTVDGLMSGADDRWDAWLVSQPWPEIARSRSAGSARKVGLTTSKPMATAQLGVAVTRSAMRSFGACLPSDVGCALVAPERRVGLRPATTTGGALAATAIAAAVIGRPDFATNDLEDGLVRDALATIVRSSDQSRDPLADLFVKPGSFDAAADIAVRVPEPQTSKFTVAEASPKVRAFAVIATIGPVDDALTRLDQGRLRKLLEAAGWSSTGGTAPASGLPSAPVVDAVITMWTEVNR